MWFLSEGEISSRRRGLGLSVLGRPWFWAVCFSQAVVSLLCSTVLSWWITRCIIVVGTVSVDLEKGLELGSIMMGLLYSHRMKSRGF